MFFKPISTLCRLKQIETCHTNTTSRPNTFVCMDLFTKNRKKRTILENNLYPKTSLGSASEPPLLASLSATSGASSENGARTSWWPRKRGEPRQSPPSATKHLERKPFLIHKGNRFETTWSFEALSKILVINSKRDWKVKRCKKM